MSFLILLHGCKDDEGALLDKDKVAGAFDAVITAAGVPEKIEKKQEEIASKDTVEIYEDGSVWRCSVKTYSVEDGNSEFPLFNPNASVVYPGSLLQGKTLSNATPSVIPLPRAGGTISTDLVNGNSQAAFTVEEVTKSSIATASNAIIAASPKVFPANFNATFEEITSEDHLAFSLGLDVQSQYVEVAADFDYTDDESYSHFLVKLNQSFYTLSFDLPTTYDDLFAPTVTPEDLEQYAGPGNPVTFISDVTYGRIYYMLIEYSSSSTEIRSSLEASFTGAVVSAGISAGLESLKGTSDMAIKTVALGGESQGTLRSINETDIDKLADLFAETSDIRSGVPISYVVRDAKDKETVSVKLATEYDVKECEAIATALGEPAMWLDAWTLDKFATDPAPDVCTIGCIEDNGTYAFFGENDAYGSWSAFYAPAGSAVAKWNDISGNERAASAIAGEANSRPVLALGAFDNGKPALEFFRGGQYNKNAYSKMTYSGGILVDTDYTIFAVVAYPQQVTYQHKNETAPWVVSGHSPNKYGYFLNGSSSGENEQLMVGFENANRFVMGHGGASKLVIEDPDFKPQGDFQVLAFRFSQTEGMAVYANGVLIAEDKSLTQPLKSNAGAMISGGHYSASEIFDSRVRIGEIKMYQQAATHEQVAQESKYINQKYGL